MSDTSIKALSIRLSSADALRASANQVLIAGGASRLRSAVSSSFVHRFHVSSLDALGEVRVFLAGEGVHAPLLVLLSPTEGEPQVLEPQTDGSFAWHPGPRLRPPGSYRLKVAWHLDTPPAAGFAPVWAYQVLGTSVLRLELRVNQGAATGEALSATAEVVGGESVEDVRCEFFLGTPEGSLDNVVAGALELRDKGPHIMQQLTEIRTQCWPEQPERPWWRLDPAHKLEVLRAADIAVPRVQVRRRPLPSSKLPTSSRIFWTQVGSDAMTTPGTYHLTARVTGRVTANGQTTVFERVEYRQVFVLPESDPQRTVCTLAHNLSGGRSRSVVKMSLRDRWGNYVLVGPKERVDLAIKAGARSLSHHVQNRADGSIEVNLDEHLTDPKISIDLARQGKSWGSSRELPVPLRPRAVLDVELPYSQLRRPDLDQLISPWRPDRRLILRRDESVQLRARAGTLVERAVAVFAASDTPTVPYVVELVDKDGQTRLVGEGEGTNLFVLPDGVDPADWIRVRALDPDAEGELELLGIDLR